MQHEPTLPPRATPPRRRPVHGRSGPDASGVIEFIQKTCYIPEGRKVGELLKLAKFQKEIIRAIYDNDVPTRRAIISMGRKNAKTSLSACLLLNHLCGPSAAQRRNSQLYSTAQSREQAGIIFSLAAKIVRQSPILRNAVHVRDNAKELLCPALGTKYRALSAEATTAFGLDPAFCVHDELGQVRGERSTLYEAIETATGAQENPLSIVISTQAPTDRDLLSMLIDDALAGHDPHTVVQLYTAPIDLDPFAEATIKMANPALSVFMNKREVMAMAASAKRMPAREAEFRNLVLNQRVEVANPFITTGVWKACGGEVGDLHGIPCYAGLDLSSVADLTAFVLVGQRDKIWNVRPTFWLPGQNLREKAALDRVPYDLWARQGCLSTTPGASVSYEYVAQFLRAQFNEYNIRKLAFDRWNFVHLKPWLIKAGFGEMEIMERFVEFGQGTQSMSPALRSLEEAIVNKQIAHGQHPVLQMCAHCAIVEGKDDSNRKLSKNKSNGRIDGMVALAMAFGVIPQSGAIDINALCG